MFIVIGTRYVYAQPSGMSCWATVYAMMKAWKRGQGFASVRAAVEPLGQPWLGYFDRDTGIPPTDGARFEAAVGFVREPRFNPSPAGWEQMLRRYGLLWVSGTVTGGIHDRIVEGISGDGTANGTQMYIVDPDGGRRYQESLGTFIRGFEGQAAVEPFYDDYQILHFAA